MQRIASFCVDHHCLDRGMYTSLVDSDVVTYDIRMKKPNQGDYLAAPALHTIEHLFATFARSSRFGDKVIYVGPMGCRTGAYFLTRGLTDQEVLDCVIESFRFMSCFEGEIPGAKEAECGNYLDHDLEGCRREAAEYLKVLEKLSPEDMRYTAYLD